jgi:hypothetical protein
VSVGKKILICPILPPMSGLTPFYGITWLVGATQPANPGPVGDLILMHSMDENFQIKSQNVVSYA